MNVIANQERPTNQQAGEGEVQKLNCRHCGTPTLEVADNFCRECGQKINDECCACWLKDGQGSSCPGQDCLEVIELDKYKASKLQRADRKIYAYCRHCGATVLKEKANFCRICGLKLQLSCNCWMKEGRISTCPGLVCPEVLKHRHHR